jgi:membrane protein
VAARKKIAKQINLFVQNTRSGTLGVTGMVMLIFVAISMLSRIEETFNDIWGVTRGRNWFVRIIQYWTTITLGPLLFACALALASGSYFQTTKDYISEVPFMSRIFPLLPLMVLWFTFALLYQLVPNTKVRFGAALVGGVVAGTLWHLNNVFGFLYVSRVVTNSKIYGGLGLVPMFMAGLYFSWLILLFGAQVAYAYQNRAAYLQEKLAENVNQRGREFVALRLMTCIGQQFQAGNHPVSVREMSAELGIPTRLIEQVLHVLVSAKLVVEVAGAEMAYAPARPLETINCHHILLAMRAGQGQELATRDEPARVEVLGEFARIQEAERQAASSVTMLALVNRAQSRLRLPAPAANSELQPAPVELISEPALRPEATPSAPNTAVVTDQAPVSGPPAPDGHKEVQSVIRTDFAPEEERDFPL